MTCKECGGEIDEQTLVGLMIGCGGYGGAPTKGAHPCGVCGRLHWGDGEAAFNRGGNKPFLENGRTVIKHKETGEVLFYF